MAKLTKDFDAVPDGEIYPRRYRAGDEVTGSVEAAAREAGALNTGGKGRAAKTKALKGAPENK